VNNLLEQNGCEITKIDTRIRTIELELEHSLINLYSDALLQQLELQRARDNLKLLSDELNIIKALSEHGLYRYVDYRLMAVAAKIDSIDYFNAETAYQLSLNQIKTACGIKDSTLFFLEDFKIEPTQIRTNSSIFVKEYQDDSLSAVWQQKVFNNQYLPQVKLYANTGLNSTSMAYLGNHTEMSAGIQLTYTLFDGRQKEINRQQQIALIEATSNLKA
jgi:outer membrane protein TolC